VLESDWTDLESELPAVRRLLRPYSGSVFLVDSYQITSRYVRELANMASVGYLGTKRLVSPELRLLANYSLNIDDDFYCRSYGKKCRLLLGPAYAPLRQGFFRVPRGVRRHVRSILLTTGNADAEGVTGVIIDSLLPTLLQERIRLRVVIGPLNASKRQLHKRYSNCEQVELLENVTNMAVLMRECDIAVSACGTTLYELAACGVPTVGFSMVPEQDANGETDKLKELGVIEYAARAYDGIATCAAAVRNKVESLVHDAVRREALSKSFHELIDGLGCERICDEISRLEAMR
jgi:UDP-2,4-diacetamido-2,4,6-trideoxy-beta-L-altropyranose hydrolase